MTTIAKIPADLSAIVTIDPGKMSGLTEYDLWTGKFQAFEMNFEDTCRFLMNRGAKYQSAMVLCSESFTIGPQTVKNTAAPWSLELIGVARAVSQIWCGRDLTLQSPAQAKRFSSDDRLKRMGFHTPGKGHANDAARHLLLLLVTRGLLPVETVRSLAAVVE